MLTEIFGCLAFFAPYATLFPKSFVFVRPMSENFSPFSPEIVNQLVRDTLPMEYIYWDTKGNGLGCSPNVVSLFGLKTPRDVFDHWGQLSPMVQPNGQVSHDYFNEIMSLADSHGKMEVDWQFQSIGGEQIPVELTCVRHSVGENGFRIAYIRDCRLHESHRNGDVENSWLISILRTCPICFAILMAERFVFVTPYMDNFLGAKVGDTFSSFITDPAMVELLSKEPQESDFLSWTPVTIRTKYGENKEMLAYSLWFDNPVGTEQIVWLVDITQSKKLESELKIAKDVAVANMKATSEFLANMSHEIRTPMNAIIGLTHLTLRTTLTQQQAEYIQTVQQSAHILLCLINDILDFSKIEAGRMVLEYREFSIGSLVSELTAVAGSLLQKKEFVELQVEMDTNLPHSVMGDSVRLHQVILNLLTNAIKFTEKGVVRLNITVVEADILSTVLRFSVTDSGIGMTPSQIAGLFQPFAQASASTTRKFGGTGLGLAICKRIVDLMHGDISCQSEAGKGTTFTFSARFGIPLEGEVTNIDEVHENRTNALLVSDFPQELETMRHYIELLGLNVYQAGATLSNFETFLHSETMKTVDFVIFDLSDLRKDFVPIYSAMQKKLLDPFPLCVATEHPELAAILEELNIKDSVLSIGKPVAPGDLFNVIAKTAAYKEELRLKKEAEGGMDSLPGKDDVVIPDSVRGAKILLAEDNKINQMVARELLRVEGFETTVADNGRIAIELLNKQKFDIVLMDVQMPEMDGLEATRRIRADERFKNLPILAMTANAMPGDHEISIEAGMNDHIAKPIDPKILYRALIKWIRK